MVKVFDSWCPKALWRSFAAVTAALLFIPAAAIAQSGGRPNIVFIMTADHAAQAAKEALCLIGADALIHEGERVVDPLGGIPAVQRIPSGGFVGIDDRAGRHARPDHREANPSRHLFGDWSIQLSSR